MKSRGTNFRKSVERVFYGANFIQSIGYELEEIGEGYCETKLIPRSDHYQQDGVIHAGVQATMADHTAGSAATSLIADDEIVLTAEFKVNFMRGTSAKELRCRAEVLKSGRQLIVAKSEIWDAEQGRGELVAFAVVTLAIVKQK